MISGFWLNLSFFLIAVTMDGNMPDCFIWYTPGSYFFHWFYLPCTIPPDIQHWSLRLLKNFDEDTLWSKVTTPPYFWANARIVSHWCIAPSPGRDTPHGSYFQMSASFFRQRVHRPEWSTEFWPAVHTSRGGYGCIVSARNPSSKRVAYDMVISPSRPAVLSYFCVNTLIIPFIGHGVC